MQRFLSICALFLLAVTISCKKKSDKYGDANPNSVVGTWELRASGGGITGQTTTYPVGNGNLLILTDSTYQRISTGLTSGDSGTYYIRTDTSASQQVRKIIIFNNYDPPYKTVIEVDAQNLTLAGEGPDMGYTTYRRKLW